MKHANKKYSFVCLLKKLFITKNTKIFFREFISLEGINSLKIRFLPLPHI